MRVLLVNQFYPPDQAPTGKLLRDVAGELARRGHEVVVLCSSQTYADGGLHAVADDTVHMVRVGRPTPARRGLVATLAQQLAFHAHAYRAARRLRPAPDVVVSLTTPPLIGLTLQHALRGSRCGHVQWVMDLYPDALAAHGLLRRQGWPFRALAAAARRQWQGTRLVVALSGGMAARLAAAFPPESRPAVVEVPPWASDELQPWPTATVNPLRGERGWHERDTVFLYSGNMGLGHTLMPFLDLADATQQMPHLRWAFSGDGRRLADVAQFARTHPHARIDCLPYVPASDLRAHLCSADVHLVSLRAAWQDVMVPSKLPAAFAVGRPVLFVGPLGSDPARWVREAGAGWTVEEGDRDGLRRVVEAACNPEERARRGAAAQRAAEACFRRQSNCTRLVDRLEQEAGAGGFQCGVRAPA